MTLLTVIIIKFSALFKYLACNTKITMWWFIVSFLEIMFMIKPNIFLGLHFLFYKSSAQPLWQSEYLDCLSLHWKYGLLGLLYLSNKFLVSFLVYLLVSTWVIFFNFVSLYCCCSVPKPCPTLCNPMHFIAPDFPVLHFLLQFAQTIFIE